MPKVRIEGIGVVNFPDDMTPDQIVEAIETEILPSKRGSAPQPKGSVSQRAAANLQKIERGEDVPESAVQPAKKAGLGDPRPAIAGTAGRALGLAEGVAAIPALAIDAGLNAFRSGGNPVSMAVDLTGRMARGENLTPATSRVVDAADAAAEASMRGINKVGKMVGAEPVDMESEMARNRLVGNLMAPGPEVAMVGRRGANAARTAVTEITEQAGEAGLDLAEATQRLRRLQAEGKRLYNLEQRALRDGYPDEIKKASEAYEKHLDIERAAENDLIRIRDKSTSPPEPSGGDGTAGGTPQDVAAYVAEKVAEREAARTKGVAEGTAAAARTLIREVRDKIVDFTAPIDEAIKPVLKEAKIELLPSKDYVNQIDRTLRANDLAGAFLKDNGFPDVVRNVPDVDAFDQYLIAKHAQTLEANGIETGRDLAKDQKLIDSLKGDYEPFAQQINEFSVKLLDYITDSGLISRELADKLKDAYPDYVPFQRVFSALEDTGRPFGGGGVGSLTRQSVVRRIQGSERQIESPLESFMQKTYDAVLQGEKNKTARLLTEYESLPGNPLGLREIKGDVPPGTHTISFLDGGTKRTFATTKEIAEAAKSIDVQKFNTLLNILAVPTRTLKIGTTGVNVPFMLFNLVRDQAASFIQSPSKLATIHPRAFVRGLAEAVGHGQVYDEVVREAGLFTRMDLSRGARRKTLEEIRSGRSAGERAAYLATNPSQLFRAVEDIVSRAEELTRIQQYVGVRDELIRKGMPEAEARIAAGRAAREASVNFARRGEWGSVLNAMIPYFNAQVQGIRTMMASFRARPYTTSLKVGTILYTPILAAAAWNLKDEKRRQVYNDLSPFEKRDNIVIVPPNPTKDEKTGMWNVIKIPLPQGYSNLMSVMSEPLERLMGADPEAASDMIEAMTATVSPISTNANQTVSTLTPQLIRPTAEVVANRNLFTGRPIVSPYLENAPVEEQVTQRTSATSRILAPKAGLAPADMDHLMRGYFGGLGSQALNVSDRALAAAGKIEPEEIKGEGAIANIERRFSLAFGGETERRFDDLAREIEDLKVKQHEAKTTAKKAELQGKIDALTTKALAMRERARALEGAR